MKKPTLKQIATLSAAGKLSVAVGTAQAQDCTTFVNLQLDDSPSFLVTDTVDPANLTPTTVTEVTLYTQAQESGSTIAFSLLGIPNVSSVDMALLYSNEIISATPSAGCIGSFQLADLSVLSAFSTGIADIPGLEGLTNAESTLGSVPVDGGVTVDEVDVIVNLADMFAEDAFSDSDDFYIQALAIPSVAALDVLQGTVSNLVHVTVNRVDAPPGSDDDGKGGGDSGDDDTPPSSGKTS